MSDNNILVRLSNIQKSYPGVKALSDVSFDLKKGEVHCLVGENGAGKSTLMKILSGAEQPDGGSIEIGSETFKGLTPSQGIALGIATIYQETDLVGSISVANNIFLGHEPRNAFGVVAQRNMVQKSQEVLSEIGVQISPKTLANTLSTANKQFVQIAKALSRKGGIIIMDEPGATLNDKELGKLFDIIHQLKSTGIGIIYISHRLNEVMKIGDRVTVLRQGKTVSTRQIKEVSIPIMIRDMVGRELVDQYGKVPSFTSEVVLSVKDLSCGHHFQNVSFELHKGEVLGLAGLVGAGRTELLNCIYGYYRPDTGEIVLHGKQLRTRSPRDAVHNGIGMVPEDRREEGLVLCRGIDENISLPIIDKLTPGYILNKSKVRNVANKYIEELKIATPSVNQIVEFLSGGNQQKVVLSKWLAASVSIFLLDEPTRGVDVGAKFEIYHLINQLANQGISVVLASSELPEIIGMSDRILVMSQGRITKVIPGGSQVTQEEIMEYAIDADV